MKKIVILFVLMLALASCSKNGPEAIKLLSGEEITNFTIRSLIEWSPDGKSIITQTKQGEDVFVSLVNPFNRKAKNLFKLSGEIATYHWNPKNNNQFVLTLVLPDSIYFYLVDLEKSKMVKIGRGFVTGWVPNGRSLLVVRDEILYEYNLDSEEYRQQTAVIEMAYSPIGNEYYGYNLYSFLEYNGDKSNLAIGGSVSRMEDLGPANGAGVWSPNGSMLAYKRYETSPHDYSLVIYKINDEPLLLPADQMTDFSWSPDSQLLVTDDWDGNIDIINMNGITNRVANGFYPSWSPIGDIIAFADAETRELQLMETEGFTLIKG